ncbi:MAG: type I-C CRISPR-associated protein Cas8c/Csd1 [Desulfovermiculus sp.]
MILQALNDYYERLRADPEVEVSNFGFGMQGVHFCLTIDKQGNLVGDPIDLRQEGRALRIEVPGPVERTVGVVANFAWDNTGYVLGADNKGKPERTQKTHEAFKTLAMEVLKDVDDEGASALLAFLSKWNPEDAESLPGWTDLVGLNVVFRLDGNRQFLHQRSAFRNAWLNYLASVGCEHTGMCLVTGRKNAPIPYIHSPIKGVPGAQSRGAALISFNFDSAISFGKKQNLNAPICEQAAFAYTTALNTLLASGSRRKVQIGDTTVVFWTDVPGAAEEFFGLAVGGKEAEDQEMTKEIEQHLRAVVKGYYPHELGKSDTAFYVLGLSPNSARLSVRFWYVGTVGQMAENIGAHYKALSLRRSFESDPKYPRPWWLLKELAPQRDSRHIPPLLAGQFVRAVVHNQPYPRTLLTTVITRIRADKQVNYLRACIIKAYLTRNVHKEIAMGLDKDNTDIGYRLGRLFAIVEHIQNDAVPGANATVRDRYFAAAAATPRRIFPVILKNAQHGLAKIRKEKPGWAITLDKSLQEILDSVKPQNGFPATMSLEKQGMFILGYYHQRQDLYTKQEDKTEE